MKSLWPDSSTEWRRLQLLPRSFPPASLRIVGVPLLSNASPELVPILGVQSLIPGVIISDIRLEPTTLLRCALLITTNLISGRSQWVTVLRTGIGNAVVWYSLLAESCSLSDGHRLIRVGIWSLWVDIMELYKINIFCQDYLKCFIDACEIE